MIPHASYAVHSQTQAQDLSAAILSATSPAQIAAACSAVDAFLRLHPGDQSRSFFSVAFPALICRLFGFDDPATHPPRSPSPSSAWVDQADPALAARIFDLLSPSGILLSSVSAVDRLSLVKFVFPVERLPEWMRYVLQSERLCCVLPDLCPLFRSRVKEDPVQGTFQIQVNVFEYYMFWFAYYPVCRGKSENPDTVVVRKSRRFKLENWTSSWSSLSSSSCQSRQKKGCGLYMQLLYAYLRALVPRCGLGAFQPYRTSLFQYSSSYDDSVILKAEFLVYTLIQFWMVDSDFSPLPLSVSSSFGVSFPFQAVLGESPPTSGLGEVLRLLVKYVNSCLVGASDGRYQVDYGAGWNASGSYDVGKSRSVVVSCDNFVDSWSSLIQRPLYRFILRTFLFCPVGNSMKNAGQVVSLWTCYMEPWKIMPEDFLEFEVSGGGNGETLGKDKCHFHDRSSEGKERRRLELEYSPSWQFYVTSNYLFYNSLVVHFMGFAHKFLHANVETIIQMVLKVLNAITSSKELMEILRKVHAAYHSKAAGPSLAVPDAAVYKSIPSIREQLQDWTNGLCERDADGSFLHENWNHDLRLFSDDEDGAHQLLQLFILRAESEIQLLPCDKIAQNLQNLDSLRVRMGILFGGPVMMPPSLVRTNADCSREGLRDEVFTPKHSGIGKSRSVDVKYRGDWMRRPISEGEVSWLARLLVRLSDRLNKALGLGQGVSNASGGPIYIKLSPNDLNTAAGPKEAMWMLLGFLWSWLGSLAHALVHFMRGRGMRINLRPLASKKFVLVLIIYAIVTVLRKNLGRCSQPPTLETTLVP